MARTTQAGDVVAPGGTHGSLPNALAKWKTLTDVTDSFTNRLAVASSVRDAARALYGA